MIAMSCSRIPATYATSRPYTRRAAPTSRFWSASTNSSAPSLIPHVPAARITWGGDSTFTSSPYALCHQLSSGPEVIIAIVPQIATHAPSGARKPQNVTPVARCSGAPANVVRSASQPHVTPASTPPR